MKKKKTLRKKPLEVLQNQNELVIKDVPHIAEYGNFIFSIVLFLVALVIVCFKFEGKILTILLCLLIPNTILSGLTTYSLLFCKKIIVDQKKKEITIHILFKRTWRFRDVLHIYVEKAEETKDLPERYLIAFDFSGKKQSSFLCSSMEEANNLVALLKKEILGIETEQAEGVTDPI